MSCAEFRPLIQDYLDHEIPAEDMRRITEHLQRCEACAQAAASLRDLKRCLSRHAKVPHAPPTLADRICRSLCEEERERASVGGRLAWFAGLSLIGLGTVTWLIVSGIWKHGPNAVGMALIEDHIHLLGTARQDDLQFLSTNDLEAVEAWCSRSLGLRPDLPRFANEEMELCGARSCYLLDRQAIVVFYNHEGRKLTLFVLEADGLVLEGMELVKLGTLECLTMHHDDHRLVCWRCDETLYALVTDAAHVGLESLVSSAYPN